MCNNGCYKAKLLVEGHPAKHTATFFPSHWSYEHVIDAIVEAYDDFIRKGGKDMIIKKKQNYFGRKSTG
jgi:hypothetical protein